MSQYFPKQKQIKNRSKKHFPKTDLKNVTHVDVTSFALKSSLASFRNKVDKLDIDKLAPVPVDLRKLSNVVRNY